METMVVMFGVLTGDLFIAVGLAAVCLERVSYVIGYGTVVDVDISTSVGSDNTMALAEKLVVSLVFEVSGVVANNGVDHFQFSKCYCSVCHRVLSVDVDSGTFRRRAVGYGTVAQLVTYHVDTLCRGRGGVVDEHTASGVYRCRSVDTVSIGVI